jgi:(2Fe-2S) ferredoxin
MRTGVYPGNLVVVAVYEHHVFVCLNERDEGDARGCCSACGGKEVHAWFKAASKARNWKGRIRVNKAGCLDQCEFGPTVVVYPEGVWYSLLREEDVLRICDEHLEGGHIVDDLRTPGLL